MTFNRHLKDTFTLALANGLALALPLAIAMALVGDTSADFSANLSFERFDGLWLLAGLPVVLAILLLLLSPLSFLICRLLRRLPGLRSA